MPGVSSGSVTRIAPELVDNRMHSGKHGIRRLLVRVLRNRQLASFHEAIEPGAKLAEAPPFLAIGERRRDCGQNVGRDNHGSHRFISREQGLQLMEAPVVHQLKQHCYY
jgi:hypothetical protein